MRFSTIFATLATVGLAAAQEAARFGFVNVSPSTVPIGGVSTICLDFMNSSLIHRTFQTINVHYNATTAHKAGINPKFVDFYIQGTFKDTGNQTPRLYLSRNDFGPTQVFLDTSSPVRCLR